MPSGERQKWEAYKQEELVRISPILEELGLTLDEIQPHTEGERYLMQAMTTAGGRKLILLARGADGTRVVVKATSDEAGKRELRHERERRLFLTEVQFAYHAFMAPREIAFIERNQTIVSIQAYIPQDRPFLDRAIEDQFMIALRAFKAQESAHATTYGHYRTVRRVFGERNVSEYHSSFDAFATTIRVRFPTLGPLLEEAGARITQGHQLLKQYDGFLTHTDFVPHNFRVSGGDLYLLDHSSIRFGNKYEGWARFTNFMALYEPLLESALMRYIRDNRTPEELETFTLMRLYRLGEILCYYVRTLEKSEGDLHTLNEARVIFWGNVLEAVLQGTQVDLSIIDTYRAQRDRLRSSEEKRRQLGLH